jgi:CelD/BcsL family acetyltransferase involved in cellulose biosynthesis
MQFSLYDYFPQELKKDWDALLEVSISKVPFLKFDYLQNWWSTRGGGEWPSDAKLAIITACEGDELVGVAPFFITKMDGKNQVMFLGSVEISDYLDFIVRVSHAKKFCTELMQYIVNKVVPEYEISKIDLFNLPQDSPTILTIEKITCERKFIVTVEKIQPSPYVPLPGDWETYICALDKKQRHEIRRKMRRAVESDIPAEMYITSDPDRLEQDIETFLTLMAFDPDKAEFLTEVMRSQMKQTMRWAFESGILQLAFLKIGTEMAAAYLDFVLFNRVWVYNSGLDRRFLEYSPGWVLLGHLLQLANEHKIAEFDFMRGNEDYKYKFGGLDRYVMRLTVEL